ncbi:MAG: metal-dependent transcriptional regulator [Anaerolineales bacterium]
MSRKHTSVSPVMAHYLGELYRLGASQDLVSPTALAEEVGVTTPAAARMMDRLGEAALIEREPYKGVRLTAEGIREALRELRYHRTAEAFLVNAMGYGWHEAHDMADALAEIADERFVDEMAELAGHPTRCPHGEPIPSRDGRMPEVKDLALTELEPPEDCLISRIKAREEGRLIYLQQIGMMPGTAIRLLHRAPFNGPVRVRVDQREEVIGVDLAAKIRVHRTNGSDVGA